MANLFPYDPSKVLSSFGKIALSGFADGTMISCSRLEDGYSMRTGVQGDTTRVRSRNRNGQVVFTLLAGSPVNALLSANAALGEGADPLDIGPFLLKDLSDAGTTVTSVASWIRKMGDLERGSDGPAIEWTLDCYDLRIFHGGSLVVF